jgi:predicted short-subunit dehydrogenase-like oxidoreductase (DUF2520 family)
MLPAMAARPRITIIGAGNLGSVLAQSLRSSDYRIDEIVARARGRSLKAAQTLARTVSARAATQSEANMTAEVVWLCVPDGQIAPAARFIAKADRWKGRVALHSSGALTSDELNILRRQGAAVASVHPLMTFVRETAVTPALFAKVPFALEGDPAAVRVARAIVQQLGGAAYSIRKEDKAAYHAWGTFASPLFTALLATTEQVAASAGVRGSAAKKRMLPILRQTLVHYAALGGSRAFSGPLVRGEAAVVKRHLRVLRKTPPAREVYVALARAALRYLPVKNRGALQKLLR